MFVFLNWSQGSMNKISGIANEPYFIRNWDSSVLRNILSYDFVAGDRGNTWLNMSIEIAVRYMSRDSRVIWADLLRKALVRMTRLKMNLGRDRSDR